METGKEEKGSVTFLVYYTSTLGLIIKKNNFFFQLTDSVYKGLFELYNQRGKAGKLFVLQFVPVLIWNYLSATTRRDHQVQYNNLHEGLNTFIQ